MTTQEFSLEFDLLYNNLDSNIAPGLNDYEKSLLLTEAQDLFVKQYYLGSGLQGYEGNEMTRDILDCLVAQADLVPESASVSIDGSGCSYAVTLPDDLWLKTYELAVIEDSSLECCGSSMREADVLPVTQDEFLRTKRSPFRGSGSRRVLRLDTGEKSVELYSKYPVVSYKVRYVRRPDPIILSDLPDGLTILGQNKARTCALTDMVHLNILQAAVGLAKNIWTTTQQSNT